MPPVDPNSRKVASIPYHRISKRFDTSEYSPNMTDNTATLEDITPFLREIEDHLTKYEVFMFKIYDYRCDFPSIFYYTFTCLIAYLGYRLSKTDGYWESMFGYCLIAFGLLMCMMFTFTDVCRKLQEKQAHFVREADFNLALIMDRYNPIFKEKGLRWAFDAPRLNAAELWTCSTSSDQEKNNEESHPTLHEGVSVIPVQQNVRKTNQSGYARLE